MNRKALAILFVAAGLYAGCVARSGRTIVEPAANLTAPQQLGERMYMAHCNQCHPSGLAGLGPALNNKPLPGFMIKMQVRKGMGAMPPFDQAKIPDDSLVAIVDYLERIRGTTRPK